MPARRPRALLALGVSLLAPVGLAAPASAASFRALVPHGGVRLPAGARHLGRLSGDTDIRAMVTLRPRDPKGLAAYAAAVSTPGSPLHHRYLTLAGFDRRFAPSAAALRAVRARLRAQGLTLGSSTANRLAIPVRGSATRIDAAFSTTLQRFVLRGGRRGYAPLEGVRLGGDSGAGRLVQGVVGLDTLPPMSSLSFARRRADRYAELPNASARSTPTSSAGPQACAAASAQASAGGAQVPAAIAAHYGMSNFYAAGDEGQGVTIALYELEPFSASDIAGYESCLGTSTPVSVETVDGGDGSGSGSGEAATDIEDVIGLAPQAQIRVYEGPQTGLGAYDTYSQIVADDAAQVISTSWGECEAQLGAFGAESENTLFEEAAAQGQTVIAAAGDQGVDDCGNGTRAVDDPAADPYVTAVGGTTLHASGDTVWDAAGGASGGGASTLWPRPAWQTATQAQSVVSCAGGTDCRELPDLSADADPDTGYVAFFRGAWRTVGGTSAAAPTIAALAGLTDAAPACAGRPIGFLDPALYAHEADFQDVTSGTNSFDGVAGFAAAPGYDMASGLGTPTAALGPALCGDSVSLSAPGAQRWATGRAVSLSPSAASARGSAISWSATGLPAGVGIIASSGRIAGTPTAAGQFTVTLSALDASGAQASASFAVTVARSLVSGSEGSRSGATVGRSTSAGRARRHVKHAAKRHRRSRHRARHHTTSHRRHRRAARHGRHRAGAHHQGSRRRGR